jgi:hypothetical protein
VKSLAGTFLRLGLDLLARTWRVEAVDQQHLTNLRKAQVPRVVVLWHRTVVPLFWWHRAEGTTLLISRHKDGGLLAAAAGAWGYGVIRGSTSRGAFSALRQVMRELARRGEVAITPDGPRGPAAVAQPGAVAAAQRTGAALVPVGAAASAVWRLGSWDAVTVPRPFARIRLVYGAPFRVAPGAEGLSAGTAQLQRSLDRVTERAQCT